MAANRAQNSRDSACDYPHVLADDRGERVADESGSARAREEVLEIQKSLFEAILHTVSALKSNFGVN